MFILFLYYSNKISFTKILERLTNGISFNKKFYNWPVGQILTLDI